MTLEETKAARYRFLAKLYEGTGGNRNAVASMWEVGKAAGLARNETDTIVQYLVGEHLIERVALGGSISITHSGVKQIEAAQENPKATTQTPSARADRVDGQTPRPLLPDVKEQEAARERDRARLLLRVYEETGGNTHAICKVFASAKAVGLEGDEAEAAYVNLVNAECLRRLVPSTPGPFVVQITQKGVNHVEANREFPPMGLRETMAARIRFLEEIYRKTNGNTMNGVSTYDGVGRPLGFDDHLTGVMVPYLEYCGLVTTSRMGKWVSLTQVGLKFIMKGRESAEPRGVAPVTSNFAIADTISNPVVNIVNIHGSVKGGTIEQGRTPARLSGGTPPDGDANKPPAVRAHDRALHGALLEAIPDGLISFLRGHDFMLPYPKRSNEPLFTFLKEWKSPQKEFIHERLEERRKALFDTANVLGRTLGELTAPVVDPRDIDDLYSVWPDKKSGPIPEWVQADSKRLNDAAEAFVNEYDRFVRQTRIIVAE